MESVLSGYPIPAVLLAEQEEGYEVIDGLQRLYTFMSFIETAFPTSDGRAFDVEQFPTAHTRSQEGGFEISGEYEERLQHYFETREQLGREAFAAACGERAREFSDTVADTGTAWEQIEGMLRHALEPARLRERAGAWMELCSAANRDEALGEEAAGVQTIWREPIVSAIVAGTAQGELDPKVSPEAAADLLLALIDGAEVAVTLGETTERLLPAATTVLRDALGAPVKEETR